MQEVTPWPAAIEQVPTAVPAFIGYTEFGPTPDDSGHIEPEVRLISSLADYRTAFGGPSHSAFTVTSGRPSRVLPPFDHLLYDSLRLYFRNGGRGCFVVSIGRYGTVPNRAEFEAGLRALRDCDEPTLILHPEAIGLDSDDYHTLARHTLAHCAQLRDRFAILDVPDVADFRANIGTANLSYGAAYYPRLHTTLGYAYRDDLVTLDAGATLATIKDSDPHLYQDVSTALGQQHVTLPASPAAAAVYVSVDRDRGVWQAPAGVRLKDITKPTEELTDHDHQELIVDIAAGVSINPVRTIIGRGTVVWGARTLAGNDPEWRYVPVRRLLLSIVESVRRSTTFAVFEPNTAATWQSLRLVVENYLNMLWRQGAFVGITATQAYFVNVGLGTSMTAQDVVEGRVVIEIGVAPLTPAEFTIVRITHQREPNR